MNLPKLNDIRLRNKLLILYFFCVFIPVLFTNLLFYSVTIDHVKKQKMDNLSQNLDLMKNDFRTKIDTVVGVSSIYYTDYILYGLLEERFQSPIDYISGFDSYIRSTMNKFIPVHKEIKNISIYTDNPTIIYSGGINRITDPDRNSDWFLRAMAQSNSFPILIRTKETDRDRDTLSLIRTLNAFPNMNLQLKILKIDMQMDDIISIFSKNTMNGHIYLLTENGDIIFSTDPAVNWSVESVPFNKLKVPEHSIILEKEYQNITYLNNWKIVGVFPETSFIEEIKKSGEFFLYLTLANFFAPTLLILLISRSLHTRLITLLRHMKKVKNQNFELIKSNIHNDEIGQLTEEFNRMAMKTKLLIEDVYVAGIQKQNLELQRKQAQLNALQSQINPHFLFNALETIRMRSLIKDEVETAKIIKNMAKIFRKSLTWGKDWVTVEEEMDLIMCFLEIQKYRFGDKLAFDIQIDPEIHQYKIPKMCFLPFVENASIHGLESIQGKGLIELRIYRSNEMLTFQLTDNGIGIPEEKLSSILSHLQDEDMGESIGIKNVFIRLKLFYGENFQFAIESVIGSGTSIRISIPCRK